MEHVQDRFDALHVQALALADGELKRIAESASCTGAQTCRILQKTLEKADIPQTVRLPEPEPKKPVLRQKRKYRFIAAAAAAVITVTAAALGVSGRLTYNKPLAEKNFGILGAARLEEMDLPETVTYTNGTVNATVEAALCDGNLVMVLMTMEAVAPDTKIDWDRELYKWQEADCEPGQFVSVSIESCQNQKVRDQCWVSMLLRIRPTAPSDTMTLTLQRQELNLPDPERIKQWKGDPMEVYCLYEDPSMVGETDSIRNRCTDGLEIEIPLTVNTPVLKLTAEDGNQVYLSGFAIYSNIGSGTFLSDHYTAYRKDGTAMTLSTPGAFNRSSLENGVIWGYSYAKLYQEIGEDGYRYGKPETYNGLFDISDVTRLEFDNTVYNVTTD